MSGEDDRIGKCQACQCLPLGVMRAKLSDLSVENFRHAANLKYTLCLAVSSRLGTLGDNFRGRAWPIFGLFVSGVL